MTTVALALVLFSALLHASWNLAAKKASGGVGFVYIVALLASILWSPVGIELLAREQAQISLNEFGVICVSAAFHVGYFCFLQAGYACGDLSLVYPLARGVGPLLSTFLAMAIYGERPSALAISGACMITGSAFLITGGPRALASSSQESRRATAFGVITGVFIACYTLWDKWAVSSVGVHPFIMEWGTCIIRAIGLTPFVLRTRRAEVCDTFHAEWKRAFVVAVLSPLSYVMILTALRTTPVSYIAPAREISILLGTLFGARLLDEQDGKKRAIAAAAMVLGVVALVIG